jgi:two-component system response regulator YesN
LEYTLEEDDMSLYKIMIVDDEVEVREGIVRRIDWGALGFEIVAEAENGQEALEKAESLELDVVLTDIKMPFIDGLTFGTHLQRLQPSAKLIIFTGFDKFEYAKEAIKLNVIEYVLKPVNAEELSQVLMRVKSTLDSELAQRRNIEMLTEVYQKSFPLMRDHFLSELLLGTVSEQEIEAQLVHFNIPIQKAKHKVAAVFELDHKGAETPAVNRELLPISLKQLVDDRLGDAGRNRLCGTERFGRRSAYCDGAV